MPLIPRTGDGSHGICGYVHASKAETKLNLFAFSFEDNSSYPVSSTDQKRRRWCTNIRLNLYYKLPEKIYSIGAL
jgi:hypothetical protein